MEEGEERQLTREEAWHLYLAKLEEEANYFSVSDSSEETDICTCQTCIVSVRLDIGFICKANYLCTYRNINYE